MLGRHKASLTHAPAEEISILYAQLRERLPPTVLTGLTLVRPAIANHQMLLGIRPPPPRRRTGRSTALAICAMRSTAC